MNEKPSIGICLFYTVLTIIGYIVAYFLVAMILAVAYSFIASIPLVGWLIRSLRFEYWGIYIMSSGIAFTLIATIAERSIQDSANYAMTLKMFGWLLIAVNVFFLIANLFGGSPIVPNIVHIIIGVISISNA